MENGPHEEAEFAAGDDVDVDEVPSATSRSGESKEDDEDEVPLLRRLKRKSGDSATASSPAKQVVVEDVEDDDDEEEQPLQKRRKRKSVDSGSASSPAKKASVEDKEEASESSSGAKHTSDLAVPLTVSPLDSAPPPEFARMPSPSFGSDDDVDVTR
jgi:hypothetical protein